MFLDFGNVKPLFFQRDSGLFDASMVDMSVIETVTVQRIGRGRGRGKGRGRGRGKAK